MLSLFLFFLLNHCGFHPLYTHTNKIAIIDYKITCADRLLLGKLERELKIQSTGIQKKYKVIISVDKKQTPLLYNSFGEVRRWHDSISANILVKNINGKQILQDTFTSRMSFDHRCEKNRLQSIQHIQDILIKDLTKQIVTTLIMVQSEKLSSNCF